MSMYNLLSEIQNIGCMYKLCAISYNCTYWENIYGKNTCILQVHKSKIRLHVTTGNTKRHLNLKQCIHILEQKYVLTQ